MKKILVVDDDKSIRLVLSTALTRSGFLVKTSATTAGFWSLLNDDEFDVMITDVGLPDGDTLDVLPKIQTLNPKMKIIVISAKSTLITAVRAEKKGAFYYFPKPFDLDELIEKKYNKSVKNIFNDFGEIQSRKKEREVLEKINKEYVDEINQSESMDSAINGLLQSLDPYSAYMSPEIFNEMQTETSGEFGGLGIEVSMESGVVKVISPIDDTPASKAGLKAGDYIVKINDT